MNRPLVPFSIICNFLSAFLLCFLLAVQPIAAQVSPNFQQGVVLFSNGQFQQALGYFQQELSRNPQDALSHYYMGLCYHNLSQFPQAAQEYRWVLGSCQDPELVQRCRAGLDVLTYMQPQARPDILPPSSGKPKIIDFYATWCGPCKRFAPTFHKAESMYGNQIQFLSLDIDKPANQALVRRHNVHVVPTLVFLDARGQVVNTIEGAPANLTQFRNSIQSSYPALAAPASR